MKKQTNKLKDIFFKHLFGLRTSCNVNRRIKRFTELKRGNRI